MLRFEKYVCPSTPREAYDLLQENRLATVVGGMMWLRLSDRVAPLAIDLSRCGLDRIEDTGGAWRIGAMVTLGQLASHPGFTASTCGVFAEAVRDVVGAQFRNLATVGGSVYARMGFSDVVTALMALDAEVELEGAGVVPILPFVERGARRDVLTHVIVRKHRYQAAFECVRNAATDFSALNAAAACWQGSWHVTVGARPKKAVSVTGGERTPLRRCFSPAELDAVCDLVGELDYGSDLRADAEWRRRVAPELVRRAVTAAAAKPRSSKDTREVVAC